MNAATVVRRLVEAAYPVVGAADVGLAAVGRRRGWTKPFLMPLLLGRIGQVPAADRALVGAGLGLSGVGDTALLGGSERAFAVGLGAFLGAHLCYLRAFWRVGGDRLTVRGALPWACLAVGVSTVLAPRAGRLAPAVAGYAVVISAMAAVAAATGRRRVAVGAAAFCLSDLLLAMDRFGKAYRGADPAVMITYLLAQHEILAGMSELSQGL